MSQPKSHHYLPATYLYGFTSDTQRASPRAKRARDTPIWHFNPHRRAVAESPIREVAKEGGLYSFRDSDGQRDNRVEVALGRVEDKVGPVLRRVDAAGVSLARSGSRPRFAERELRLLRRFAFEGWRRNPNLLRELRQQSSRVAPAGEDPNRLALMTMARLGHSDSAEEGRSVLEILWDMPMILVFVDASRTGWITTEEPFARWNKGAPNGIIVPGTEVYFPLTRNCLLCLTQAEPAPPEWRFERDRAFVREVNRLLANRARRLILGASQEQVAHLSSRHPVWGKRRDEQAGADRRS